MTDNLLLNYNNFTLYKALLYNLSLSYHKPLPPVRGAGTLCMTEGFPCLLKYSN